jgi:hypothetical protein
MSNLHLIQVKTKKKEHVIARSALPTSLDLCSGKGMGFAWACNKDRDHRLQGLLLRVSVFRCCVNNPYLTVVTDTFLYMLPRSRCLCHNLGDVLQKAVT